jgi:cell division protein FtsB
MKRLILLLLLLNLASAEHINDTTDIEINNTAIVYVYDADMVMAYQSLVAEQRINITRLQSELEKKNKLLAEYITYKKKNVELQQNISKLNNQITTLKAENEIIKQHNEQYKDVITDLISKQSNETKSSYVEAYNEWKKDMKNFKIATTLGVIVCLVIGIILVKVKQRYEIPL